MAKAQVAAARFVTEVAPPPVVPVMRRRKVPWCLDTIAEDDREHLLVCGSPSDYDFAAAAAAAWTFKRLPPPPPTTTTTTQPRERAGGFMARDLGKYFSDANGCQPSGWDGGHKLANTGHRRRAVHAQELHEVGA